MTNPTNPAKYASELETIIRRFDDELTALGVKVREKIVVPTCRKHKLQFTSGMGTFFFTKDSKGGETYDDPHAPEFTRLPKATQATLRPILELLDKEVSHGQYLGYWVEDVD